jgi:hypothetical protein
MEYVVAVSLVLGMNGAPPMERPCVWIMCPKQSWVHRRHAPTCIATDGRPNHIADNHASDSSRREQARHQQRGYPRLSSLAMEELEREDQRDLSETKRLADLFQTCIQCGITHELVPAFSHRRRVGIGLA